MGELMEFLRNLLKEFIVPRTTVLRENTLIFMFDGGLYFNTVKFTKIKDAYHIELYNRVREKLVNHEKLLFVNPEDVVETFIRNAGLMYLLI